MSEELLPGQQALVDEGKPESPEEPQEPKEEKSEEVAPSSETKEEEKVPYKGKFKQFKTVEELETSFAHSFKEAQRLNSQISDLEKKIEELSTSDQETGDLEKKVSELEGRLTKQEEKQVLEDQSQYESWMEQHPDLKENDPLTQELLDELGFVAQKAVKKGEFLSMNEALNRAWTRVKPSGSTEEAELEAATKVAAKNMAAAPAPSGSVPSSSSKPALTESERKTARSFGFTDEEYEEFKKKK